MIELLKRFSGKYRLYLIVGPACKLIEVFFDLLTPLVIAQMIDKGVRTHDVRAVLFYGGLLVGMAAVGIAFTLVCQKMAALSAQGVGTDIRSALYAHINRLSYAELDRFGTPSLITRITNDVNQVQLAVALGVRQLIRWPFLAVGSMVAALLIDLKLGLIFLVSTPLIGVVFWLVMAKCIPYFKQMQVKLDRIGLICREGLSGVRVIRAFVREEHERDRFRVAAREQADTAIAVGKLSSMLNPVTFLVMNLAVCCILWMGGLQVDTGVLTQGQVMAFVNYMTQTLLSIVYVANLVVVFTKASASASRINEVLHCEPSIVDDGAAEVVLPEAAAAAGASVSAAEGPAGVEGRAVAGGPADGKVHVASEGSADGKDRAAAASSGPAGAPAVPALEMDGACFTFGAGAANAVDNVSLRLPLGSTLGVIGGTGSGKSTLVSLIPRLYDTSAGTVRVMGTDVRAWPLKQLRHVVGIVPQKASLVSGTIRSNLQWRDAAAKDNELWAALECAQAAEFVRKLPQGLDAPVEAGGKNFSGGQRQRLTIARALVGTPRVLILDDSASALDFKTDAALRRAIHKRSQEGAAKGGLPLTTVIVSQRVSTVRDADMICVLSHGAVAGLGTHDELYRTCELYREICLSQLKREELEGGAGAGVLADTGAPAASAAVDGGPIASAAVAGMPVADAASGSAPDSISADASASVSAASTGDTSSADATAKEVR